MTAEAARTPVSSAVIVARGLVRRFGDGAARVLPVDHVDLDVRAGELILLGGPSGSGKSTLLHLLTGFDRCDDGTVSWAGVADGEPPPWNRVAVVPQSLGLLPELTYAENVSVPLLLAGVPRAEVAAWVEAIMGALDVAHLARRLPGETSLGQQQRCAVARALVGSPAALLADEPTSHQDAAHGALVLQAIRTRVDAGMAAVLAGHDPLLEAVADRHLVLVDGKLHDAGSVHGT